jgi:hypothetical protein
MRLPPRNPARGEKVAGNYKVFDARVHRFKRAIHDTKHRIFASPQNPVPSRAREAPMSRDAPARALVVIPARMASSRLPGKPLADI